jgi:Xaa-Pro aminopeptidase
VPCPRLVRVLLHEGCDADRTSAYLLNLRGSDIAFNPLFVSYLYVDTNHAILFIDQEKINEEVSKYLNDVPVEVRPYDDVWKFLGSDEMGEGKVLINGATSQAITAQLPDRFTIAVDYVENTKAVKNETELAGFRKAYTRDSAAYVSQILTTSLAPLNH